MPTVDNDPVEFPKDVHDAFFRFSFEHKHDQRSMIDRLMSPEEFDGELKPLNFICYYDLFKAVFYGYKPALTPAEKLLEEIREARNNRNQLNAFDVDQHQLESRYIKGLERAAKIMGVK